MRIESLYYLALALAALLASDAVCLRAQAQTQEQVQINAEAPTTPFPHFCEQMFGSGRAILSRKAASSGGSPRRRV